MFRTISRLFLPNPLDWALKRTVKRGGTKILIGWNRGLGDIALGLYAIVHRIREMIPNADITFLTRENLRDGFSMLEGVRVLVAPDWKRGQKNSLKETLCSLGIDPKEFDLILARPSPTDWVRWQRGTLIPRLKWDPIHEPLWKSFGLSEACTYIGVQPIAETQYGFWRNWPHERWVQLFDRLEKLEQVKVLLFGFGSEPRFSHSNIVDLRGKTTLFELLSIVKNCCQAVLLPDSGILSMIYYLDAAFPIRVVSLWADPDHGILKQGVFSPNPQLRHCPLIGAHRDLSSVSAQEVMNRLFPPKPLLHCRKAADILALPVQRTGAILLAGGQGSRLGAKLPKGLFPIREKSLFQWICEKVPPDVPIAVMTSPLNHAETAAFFGKQRNFGREIYFFQQELLPLRNEKNQPIGVLAPDGNGSVFKSFSDSGICRIFEDKGIDLVSIVPVENPLADPADPVLISCLRASKADVVVKCIEQHEAEPSMGALVERMGRLEIVEYTELDTLAEYRYRYTGMMAMTLAFMKRLAGSDLPLHWVWKQNGKLSAWKGERFLFDALALANHAEALCYPRNQIYEPLKSIKNLCQIEKILKEKESHNLL